MSRPCRNDITRLTKDPEHHPRWEKCQITECVIPQCKNTFFSNCSVPSDDILQCLTLKGENIPPQLEVYLLHFANTITTLSQLNCQTCCAVLRKQNARPCPDPETIRTYLEETTGYEDTLNDGDKVCFACYKSHLHILKHSQSKHVHHTTQMTCKWL